MIENGLCTDIKNLFETPFLPTFLCSWSNREKLRVFSEIQRGVLVLLNFSHFITERKETWSLGGTESEVWIINFNVKAWITTEHKLHNICCSLKLCKISGKRAHPWDEMNMTTLNKEGIREGYKTRGEGWWVLAGREKGGERGNRQKMRIPQNITPPPP